MAGADLSWRGIPADGSGIDGSTKIAFGSVDLLEIADDAIASHHIRTQAVGASELATYHGRAHRLGPTRGEVGSVSATCLEDSELIGGGAYFAVPSGDISATCRVFGSHTLFAEGQNNGNVAQNLTVQALCLI